MLMLSVCVLFLLLHQVRFLSSGSIDEMVKYSTGRASRSLRTYRKGMDSVRHSKVARVLAQFQQKSADLAPPDDHVCHAQQSRKVFIRGRQYGQFSNSLISLAHGLGFVDTLNAYHRVQEDGIQYALVVPNYMVRELKSFDLRVLLDHYCLVINEVPSAIEQADQEESFSWSTLFSTKKSVAVKINRLAEVLWAMMDCPAKSLRRDIALLEAHEGRNHTTQSSALSYSPGRNDDRIELDSKDLFFWGHSGSLAMRMRKFPELYEGSEDHATVLKAERDYYTRHYVAILCALWSHVSPSVIDGALVLLRELARSGEEEEKDARRPEWEALLEYSAAHQRGLDGECDAIMKSNADWERDFPRLYNNDTTCKGEWCQRRHRQTLLCDMPPGFLRGVCDQESPDSNTFYLASEAAPLYKLPNLRGEEEKLHFVAGWDLRRRLGLVEGLSAQEISCMDLLLCVLGTGVFIGNPRSTFSFQITTLRAVLGQRSVPRVRNHDLYFLPPRGEALWISQSSVVDIL